MAAKVIKIEIPIETQDKTDPALGSVTAKMEDLDNAAKNAQKSMDSASKSASGFEKSLGKSMDNVSKKASGFEKSLGSVTKQKWQILLEAKDKITPTVKQAITYVKSLSSKAWRVTLKAVDLVTSPVKRVFGLLKSPLVAAGVTISAGSGIASTVKTYAEFEAAMSQVKAISGATGEEFTQLTEKAKQMGATTKFTAAQSAEAFNYMAMAGWKASDMMSGIEGIMNLAAASGEDLGTTSDIVTDALTAFNLKASDSTHFADVLAQASANANTNVSKMGQTFQYVAPVAGAMGYSIEDTALAIGLMANAGIKGEKAGTALRSIFTRLADPPKDAAGAIEKLGLSITNADGSMRPLNDVMKDLRKSFAGLTQEQKVQIASQLAGQEAMSGLLALVNASEEDYNKLAEAIGNADGASKKMSDTMLDNLSGMMQEAASKKVQDSFGNIKLSVKEIKDAAKQIVFGDQEQAFTKFSSAASDAQNSLANLQSSVSTMDKLNWKASLGMKFDDNEISEYIAGVDNMLSSASQYLEDKHYQAKAAIDLLVEPGNETDMTTGLNAMYADMQSKIESLGKDLHAKVNVALEDGVITLDEQAEITNLQNQITDITNQISQAETEASFQSLKVKYSGASLDADSFANLVAEIQTNVQEAAQSYDDALEVSLTNLNLQLQSGAINQEQFDAQLQALTEGYQAKITDLSVRVESFELQSIADAFGSELDGILPDIEGTVAEKLGTAMHNAMAAGVDVENWDVSTASQWLDLDGLSAETQSAITELMSQVAASLPDQMSSALSGTDIDMSDSVNSMVNSSIENVDLSGAGETLMGKVNESMNGLDMSESGAGLQDSLQTSLLTSLENVDLSGAGETLNAKLGESMASLDMSESGSGLQESIQSSITSSIEGVDLTEAASSLNTSLSAALSSAESIDTTGFATALQSSIAGSVQGLDYSGVTSAVGTGISNAITATMGTIQGAISTLYSDVGAAINSAFAAGFTTTTTVTITVNYQLANPTATISFSGGGSGSATVSGSIASNANGGFSYGPELTWWGEDGPEVIIPLGSKRRRRGLELWAQAGQILGIPQHAEGGMIGNPASAATYYDYTAQNAIQAISEEDSDTSEPIPTSVRHEGESGTKEVKLNVNVNPQFVISGGGGQSDEDIMRIIKSHFKELADDLGGELADRLGEVFSNMPVNA